MYTLQLPQYRCVYISIYTHINMHIHVQVRFQVTICPLSLLRERCILLLVEELLHRLRSLTLNPKPLVAELPRNGPEVAQGIFAKSETVHF